MEALPAPDVHCLMAAVGWLELGNPAEAKAELEGISREYWEHPAVLDTRWWLASATQSWEEALALARLAVERFPERVSGWIHRAYALRRVPGGSIQQAREALLPALEKFPKEDLIPFNLACYAAQLGELKEAWDLLHKCMEVAGSVESVKERALADEDLKPLWERIKEL